MLYFNDFIKILDIIQDYHKERQVWQEDYPYIIDIRVNSGEATEEEKEYLLKLPLYKEIIINKYKIFVHKKHYLCVNFPKHEYIHVPF